MHTTFAKSLVAIGGLTLTVVLIPFAIQKAAGSEPTRTSEAFITAGRLVSDARKAETSGDAAAYYRLLREALRVDPDFELARWQLGQIKIDGQWVAVEESQRRAAQDPIQAQYRELRKSQGDSEQNELAIARWCRKNNLGDEARFHWSSILARDPGNDEALRALKMTWWNGALLTHDQVAQQKRRQLDFKRLERTWAPVIAKWRRDLASEDADTRAATLEEIRVLRSTDVIAFLEPISLHNNRKSSIEECQKIAPAFVDALSNIDDAAATESLVRHAVFSSLPNVQAKAIAALKERPPHKYVPMLLSALAMPVESSFNVRTSPDGSVHYTHSLYREGQYQDSAIDANYSTLQDVLPGHKYVYRRVFGIWEDRTSDYSQEVASNATKDSAKYFYAASTAEMQVANANAYAAVLNTRIMPVLANTTGQDLQTPKQWWDWWQNENEYYQYEHPVERQYYAGTNRYIHGQPCDTYTETMSCFTKGTPVWTKTGQRAIESIELGDLVLAQNVETGELSYKPVVGRTVRPPSAIVVVRLPSEEIRATLGHPFWVAGTGWQMAKELKERAVLHGVTGLARVSLIKPAEQEEAYNLVVADFATYFVGESGILVHDNTPRTPTQSASTGLVAGSATSR